MKNLFVIIRQWFLRLGNTSKDSQATPAPSPPTVQAGKLTVWTSLAGISILRDASTGMLQWTAGMAIDADGSPRAYHPVSSMGLDDLANAGKPGNWWGVVTDTGKVDGRPIVQGAGFPFPGYYVSATSLTLPGFARTDPGHYVDSEKVAFVVVPPQIRQKAPGIVMGCRATISYGGKTVEAVVADIGPRTSLGEASVYAAKALGIPSSPRSGGTNKGVTYRIYPGQKALNGDFPLVPA